MSSVKCRPFYLRFVPDEKVTRTENSQTHTVRDTTRDPNVTSDPIVVEKELQQSVTHLSVLVSLHIMSSCSRLLSTVSPTNCVSPPAPLEQPVTSNQDFLLRNKVFSPFLSTCRPRHPRRDFKGKEVSEHHSHRKIPVVSDSFGLPELSVWEGWDMRVGNNETSSSTH